MSGYIYPFTGGQSPISFQDSVEVLSKDSLFVTSFFGAYPSVLAYNFHYTSSDINNNTVTFVADWTSSGTYYHDTIVYNYTTYKIRHAKIQSNMWMSVISQ